MSDWPKETPLENGGHKKEWVNGLVWYFDAQGRIHREDGPAAVWSDGKGTFYIHGAIMTPEQHAQWVKDNKSDRVAQLEAEIADLKE